MKSSSVSADDLLLSNLGAGFSELVLLATLGFAFRSRIVASLLAVDRHGLAGYCFTVHQIRAKLLRIHIRDANHSTAILNLHVTISHPHPRCQVYVLQCNRALGVHFGGLCTFGKQLKIQLSSFACNYKCFEQLNFIGVHSQK